MGNIDDIIDMGYMNYIITYKLKGMLKMIRSVRVEDAARIVEIYDYYVNNTSVSFEITTPSINQMQDRIAEYTKKYPWLVYELEGKVIGYAYATKFREREAYRYTVVLSVYFSKDYCGRGYGKEIMLALIEKLRNMGFYTAIAGVTYPNVKSEGLFRSLGFEYVGMYKNVGYKNNEWLSVMQFSLPLRTY